jgi:predicted alpha-1,2-mannosidase
MATRFDGMRSTLLCLVLATLLAPVACGGGKGAGDTVADPGPGDLADVSDVADGIEDATPADLPDVRDVPPPVELPPLPNLSPLVDPFIGTKGPGNVIPGPCVPRGMVKLSPDTNSGRGSIDAYDWDNDRIQGFSHTHLEGPGGSNNGYSQILVMATNGVLKTTVDEYASAFSHEDEAASPGYYAVTLQDYGIRAELTAAAKCGVHRYTFANAGEARVLVDLSANRGYAMGGEITLVGDRRAEGFGKYQVNPLVSAPLIESNPGTGEATVYFALELDRAFLPTSAVHQAGDSKLGHLDLSLAAGDVVEARVGISYLSVEQARKNLVGECLGRTFDVVRQAAVDAWNRKLWRAEVTGGTDAQRRVFHTALYHTFLVPADYTEDGQFFSGWDGVGKVVKADGWRYHADDWCAWDTARATHPLATILDPETRSDMAQSYVQTYKDGGWMAKATWNALGDARCMTANFQFCILADAAVKGFKDFDVETAWEAMVKGATQDSENILQDVLCGYLNQGTPPDYVNNGFVSQQCDGDQSASMTLEYAFNDFCIAQFADAIGKSAEGAKYRERSNNWKNVFDTTIGFARPRNRDGTWEDTFDPTTFQKGFTEADSWKYSWHVNQDICGLVDAMGGPAKFEAKLDEFFADDHFDMGNEPDFHVPFLYPYVGKAAKTQALTDGLLARHFTDQPDGLPGNDDAGATSAWIVFAMIGLYPVAPSDPTYVITSPVFETTVLHMDPERQAGVDFTIRANGVSATNRFIQSATLNGVALDTPRIAHADIAKGGTLVLTMGASASTWGASLCPIAP